MNYKLSRAEENVVFVYPGSFNPLHWGHLAVAHYVNDKFDRQVVFELSTNPLGKAPLTLEDVQTRKSQFDRIFRPLVTTNAQTFVQKMRYKYEFSSAIAGKSSYASPLIFCVGYDTIVRIGDSKFYFDSETETERCVELFQRNTCKFLVFPRDGRIDTGIRPSLRNLCIFADDFTECCVSSTELRTKNGPKQMTSAELDAYRYANRKDFS